MKVGSAVKLNSEEYPQYRGWIGVLCKQVDTDQWQVNIKGRMHPYKVSTSSMELLKK
jgi:hypothetical protein